MSHPLEHIIPAILVYQLLTVLRYRALQSSMIPVVNPEHRCARVSMPPCDMCPSLSSDPQPRAAVPDILCTLVLIKAKHW
jgi:hypothetical protein